MRPVADYGLLRDGATDGELAVMAAAEEDHQPAGGAPSSDQWHDAVTGLPRPPSFLAGLERALARMHMQARRVALVLLEVTDFAWLKRDLGPAAGDELLRTVAERLHAQVPDPALLTRIRDAEFAIVFSDLDPEFSAEDLATRLLERVSEPYPIGNRVLSCKVIAAVRLAGDRSESGHGLLERAAVALGRARVRDGQGSAGRVAVAPPRSGRLARCEAGLRLGQSEGGGPIADAAPLPAGAGRAWSCRGGGSAAAVAGGMLRPRAPCPRPAAGTTLSPCRRRWTASPDLGDKASRLGTLSGRKTHLAVTIGC